MHTIFIFALSLTAAYVMSRVRRASFARADLAIALYSGIIGATLAYIERGSGGTWSTLPALLAVLVPIGFQAISDSDPAQRSSH